MKRLISTMFLIGTFIMTLTSCGPGDSGSSSDPVETTAAAVTSMAEETTESETTMITTTSTATSTRAVTTATEPTTKETFADPGVGKSHFTEELMDAIKATGEITLDMDYDGDEFTGKIYLTTDGDNSYLDVDIFGFKLTQLTNKDGAYILDNAAKKYYFMGEDYPFDLDDIIETFVNSDLVYAGTEKAELNGASYFCEKFADGSRYYYDTESFELRYITADDQTTPIREFSAKADDTKFKLPSDYTEMTADDFKAWSDDAKTAMQ